MSSNVEKICGDLQQLVGDLEKLLSAATGDSKSHAEQAVANWREALKGAQERLQKVQDNTRERIAHSVRTANHALRDNPWKSMAIVAATGFLLGLALRGHDGNRSAGT